VTGGDAGLRERYASRAAAHAREADTERGRSLLISRLRLLTILPALTILAWALWRGATPVPVVIGVALLASFAALVVWHARVEDRVAWLDARRAACEWGIARLSRDWGRLPAGDAPEGLDLPAHPYALDLDLFGRASLFRLLGPPATPGGARTLAGWLRPARSQRASARCMSSPRSPPGVRISPRTVCSPRPRASARSCASSNGPRAARRSADITAP
jgi:hypothetical protein